MGQLKTDFDVQKYTIASKGPFIASQFHMLMRQYGLAKYEMTRMILDRNELDRKIADYEDQMHNSTNKLITVWTDKGMQDKYIDIELARLKNELKQLEITAVNKIAMVERFEQCRKILIERNGGSITNEQYQAEQPEQQKWMLLQQCEAQIAERATGIKEGTIQAIELLKAPALINKEFEVQFQLTENGQIDLNKELLMLKD